MGVMALQWTNHPILSVPTKEEQIVMGPEKLIEYYERREAAIEREREDPFNFGTELPHWKMADDQLKEAGELVILGGNRSGKTTAMAKRVVQSLVSSANRLFHFFFLPAPTLTARPSDM